MTEEQSVAVETPAVEIDAAPVLPAEPAEGGDVSALVSQAAALSLI